MSCQKSSVLYFQGRIDVQKNLFKDQTRELHIHLISKLMSCQKSSVLYFQGQIDAQKKLFKDQARDLHIHLI